MISFENTYSSLPDKFYAPATPEQVRAPRLIAVNHSLATELGLDLSRHTDDELAQLFTGQSVPETASSLALAYAGHQFGHFNPQLGDGRALLLGEVVAPHGGRFDIQLKGSGRTAFSRGGDGKSWVGPVIREYILSEAMYALGIPTTRALAAALTGEQVFRERSLPGGVFTRVAASHIRVGTFEYFAARRDFENLKILADYAIERHYPEAAQAENPYLSFIEQVAGRQAALVSRWMSIGFIHGVMNTDNMSISGETIDYGPCAFVDNFSFDKVFSSIDHGGRYAYNNQLNIARWNLLQLANSVIPLVDEDEAAAIKKLEKLLGEIFPQYDEVWLETMVKKFGIFKAREGDKELVNDFLQHLEDNELDFALSFRELSENPNNFTEFRPRWQQRLAEQEQSEAEAVELMRSVNPVLIARNHQVERAIQAAVNDDFSVFEKMNLALMNPLEENEEFAEFKTAPQPEERVKATFCGT